MTTHPDSSSTTKAYRQRVGLMAELPNFPGPWNEVMEKIKIADELGFNSIWLAESWGYELFTSMTDVVRVTKRIQVCLPAPLLRSMNVPADVSFWG